MSILRRARPEILALQPYQSARSFGMATTLLNANESPWMSFTTKLEQEHLNRYPEPQPEALLQLMADYYQADPQQLMITRGSDEAIDILVRAFCRAGKDSVLQCPPCFGMYAIAAGIQGAEIINVPLLAEQGFALDIEGIKDRCSADTKIVFLTSPNNPTGNSLGAAEIDQLARHTAGQALLVVDEAYIEFSHQPSVIQALNQHQNLVVLRTLSKAFGMAGLRCGACIGNAAVIQLLKKILPPYPLPQPSISLAVQALSRDNLSRVKRQIAAIQELKSRLLSLLRPYSWVRSLWPGDANFVLLQVDDALGLCRYLAANNILIRDFSRQPLLPGCVRISVGSEEELGRLALALEGYRQSGDTPLQAGKEQ